jgi:transposase-like protein
MTELVRQQPRQPYRKFSPEQMVRALEESKGLIAPAARALGCSRDTIRKYLDEYGEVAQAKLDQREAVTDMAENSLYEAIRRGEAWAVCFYLKCMAKDRGYIERAELTGNGGGPVKIKLVYDE